MTDTFVMAILPYAVMVGIAVSAIASIALVVSTFLKTQRLDARILPRLAEISSSIERNAEPSRCSIERFVFQTDAHSGTGSSLAPL